MPKAATPAKYAPEGYSSLKEFENTWRKHIANAVAGIEQPEALLRAIARNDFRQAIAYANLNRLSVPELDWITRHISQHVTGEQLAKWRRAYV